MAYKEKGYVVIDPETTKNPLQLMGIKAGTCWGADTTNKEKNIKRAIECLESGHKRVAEYPQVFFDLKGYSIAVMREFYTHIGGAPTRLQDSTRYIDFADGKSFEVVFPPSIKANPTADMIYAFTYQQIDNSIQQLKKLGIPKEDYTKLLPLATRTNVCVRMGLLELIQIAQVRLCSRAYWEFRKLMKDVIAALADYSEEWKMLVDMGIFVPKCETAGYCTEARSCGRKMTKEEAMEILKENEDSQQKL